MSKNSKFNEFGKNATHTHASTPLKLNSFISMSVWIVLEIRLVYILYDLEIN